MPLLAEAIVEEWLNRKGYFTIRGIKLGVDEIDLLALRHTANGGLECRHLEVQVSVRPVSYICRVPREVQRSTGRAANSAKRSPEELVVGVSEWVEKKFRKPSKVQLMRRLCPAQWTSELVVHNVKSEKEVEMIRAHGVQIHRLAQVVAELRQHDAVIQSASGGDLLELIHLSASTTGPARPAISTEADIIAS